MARCVGGLDGRGTGNPIHWKCTSLHPTARTIAQRLPGAQELCNDVDDNCNGIADENLLNPFYFDADQDGFGDALHDTLSCGMPIGFVENPLDCNDAAITYLDLDSDGFGSGLAQRPYLFPTQGSRSVHARARGSTQGSTFGS